MSIQFSIVAINGALRRGSYNWSKQLKFGVQYVFLELNWKF